MKTSSYEKKKKLKEIVWLRQVSSFSSSRIILTANNFRIFDNLEGKGETVSALSATIATDRRATELLLNSLVAIGLLEKKNNLYRNAPVASKYLIIGKPYYQGDILRHASTLWDNWSGLDTVLKTGKPHKKSRDNKSFILGMHNLATQKVKEVIKSVDLTGIKCLLDLGGGPGSYSMAFAKEKIHVTLMDYPDTLRISKKLIKDAGMEKNIKLLPGNFTQDVLGGNYDMVFISHIFHAYGIADSLAILRRCYDVLHPGGKIAVQDFNLHESKTSPLQGAVFAINMLVNTLEGRSYTPKEMSSWMKEAGFRNIRRTILDETVLMTGTKKK
jgi:ubiquinone/menaquinone biosynthesis C-methylase UbiE